jgi:hypothetical protein
MYSCACLFLDATNGVSHVLLYARWQESIARSRRTDLARNKLSSQWMSFVLFFSHLVFSSVSVILPQIQLGILDCHLVCPNFRCTLRRYTVTPAEQYKFLLPSKGITDACVPCAHLHFQLMSLYILESLAKGHYRESTRDQDKISDCCKHFSVCRTLVGRYYVPQ